MKWKNPAHEYDDAYLNVLSTMRAHNNQIYLFGWGKIGKEIFDFYKESCINIAGIIDNDIHKVREKVNEELEVISYDMFVSQEVKGFIVITVSEEYSEEIIAQLLASGMKYEIDFCDYIKFKDDIVPLLELYGNNKLWLDVVEIALTERCTLKCKKCAHGCCYVNSDNKDMPIEMAMNSIDNLFRLTDRLYELYLIGGEPLLYNELPLLVEYIGKKYRSKIYRLVITTNGTIMPSNDLLNSSKMYDVTYYISNYATTLPHLRSKYNELCRLLEESGISYKLSGEDRTWYDYGFDYVNHGFDFSLVEQIHDQCFTRCREIRGSKFYYCIQARSVSQNMHFEVKDEYLDLLSIKSRDEKKILYEYSKGYCRDGYLEMCNYCNGSESVKYHIPVAEQM